MCIVPGPIGVFRKKALAGVGYYDHDTFAEDCDLTLKLLLDGWKVTYEPKAISHTEAPEDLISLIKQRYRWTRGILQALRKYRFRMLSPRGVVYGHGNAVVHGVRRLDLALYDRLCTAVFGYGWRR